MAKNIVVWKGKSEGGKDMLMTGFDTVIEARAYALGFIDAICMFSKDGEKNRDNLLTEIIVRTPDEIGKDFISSSGSTNTKPNKDEKSNS